MVTVLHHFSGRPHADARATEALGLRELSPIAELMVKQMLFLDPPAHTRVRALASSAFTPAPRRVLRDAHPGDRRRLIDDVLGAGDLDVIADLAAPLPAIVTAEMLGVPAADHEQLKEWSADFAEMLGNFQHNPERVPKVLQSGRGHDRLLPARDQRAA